MGLFSTLLHSNSATESSGGEKIATTTSDSKAGPSNTSSELPTVVQLLTRHPIPLTTDTAWTAGTHSATTASNAAPQPPSFAALHYTAVQCLTELSVEEDPWGHSAAGLGASLRGSSSRKNKEFLVPDLGVWNAKVDIDGPQKLLDALLPLTQSNTFCMVVDWMSTNSSSKGSRNNSADVAADLSQVEPSITKIQEALVRLLIQKYKEDGTSSSANTFLPTQTTSLFDLRSVQFGLGDKDESAAARINSITAAAPEEADRSIRIALQICVKQPSRRAILDNVDYKTQQLHKVLIYHLRKYAAALNASLVFVSDPLDSPNDMGSGDVVHSASESATAGADRSDPPQQPTVTTAQLPLVWKALAQGKPVWKYATMEAVLDDELVSDENPTEQPVPPPAAGDSPPNTEENNSNDHNKSDNAVVESVYSLIYGPDNHNTELIESVLQRSANYPGHWDVATDSVWKILPPVRASSNNRHDNKSTTTPTAAGDATWLTELRDSIKSSDAAASLQTPPAKGATDDSTKTPNDAAVSSFFQGLLS